MNEEIIPTENDNQKLIYSSSQKSLPEKLIESITSTLANITEEKVLRVISDSIEGNSLRKKAIKIIYSSHYILQLHFSKS